MARPRKLKSFKCGCCNQKCHTLEGLRNHGLHRHRNCETIPFWIPGGTVSLESPADDVADMAEAAE